MVLPRVLTSIVLVPVVVAVVWFGQIPFAVFVAAVCLFATWEYSVMAEMGGYPNQLLLSLFGSAVILAALFIDGSSLGPVHRTPGVLATFVGWLFLVFLREIFRYDHGHSYLRAITTVTGVVICALLIGHLLLLRELRFSSGEGTEFVGRKITFFLIITIWVVDTGAWAVGRMIGRTPFAGPISPKKTWEGSIGGTVLACAAAWLFREAFLKQEMTVKEGIAYSLVIAITAQISDLVESLIKRSFGVKDSSQLLPGHGGILDRFDSFIFAAPFFYYALIFTGRFF